MKLYLKRSLSLKGYVYTFYDNVGSDIISCRSNYAIYPAFKCFYSPQDEFVLRQRNLWRKMGEMFIPHICPYFLYENGAFVSVLRKIEKEKHYRFFYNDACYDIVKQSLCSAFVYKDSLEVVLFTKEKEGCFGISARDVPLPLLGVLCMFMDELFFNQANINFSFQGKGHLSSRKVSDCN